MFARLLWAGPDPLYLMETCPTEFATLCYRLGLSEDQGREAIEAAHCQGPGVLLEGTGMPVSTIYEGGVWNPSFVGGGPTEIPLAWRKEALWLLLAVISDCTEEGYRPDVSLITRIKRGSRAAIRFAGHLRDHEGNVSEHWYAASTVVQGFMEVDLEIDAVGLPHGTDDHTFYVAFKKGFPAVHIVNGPIFYGTIPSTSLAEQGITVDKEISSCFGMVFGDK